MLTKEKSRQKRKVVNNENNPEKRLFPVINNSYNIIMYKLLYFNLKAGITGIHASDNRNNRYKVSINQE